MHHFRYIDDDLCCEAVPVAKLAAKYGTPLYVYSQRTITENTKRLVSAMAPLEPLICYAVKANSNVGVLRTLAILGCGFDVVSEGELLRVTSAGGDSRSCVFAGVGKTEAEITHALRQGIYAFNVESEPELERINRLAGDLKTLAPISVRVNPNVAAGGHAKITTGTYENKFGIAFEQVEAVYAKAAKLKNVKLRGMQMHIGSQITEVKPFAEAVRKIAPLAARIKAQYGIEFFSLGGGIGVVYEDALASGSADWWQSAKAKKYLTPEQYAATLIPLLQPLGLRILLEPGRFIVANAGALITRVEYIKNTGKKNFVIVDAAMNDLVRPAMYGAYHEIVAARKNGGAQLKSDVVGPVCESGDCFCKDRPLPKVGEGDYLAILTAGAYGSCMASNYNSRPLPEEIMVSGAIIAPVHLRQLLPRIWENDKIPRWFKYGRVPKYMWQYMAKPGAGLSD